MKLRRELGVTGVKAQVMIGTYQQGASRSGLYATYCSGPDLRSLNIWVRLLVTHYLSQSSDCFFINLNPSLASAVELRFVLLIFLLIPLLCWQLSLSSFFSFIALALYYLSTDFTLFIDCCYLLLILPLMEHIHALSSEQLGCMGRGMLGVLSP